MGRPGPGAEGGDRQRLSRRSQDLADDVVGTVGRKRPSGAGVGAARLMLVVDCLWWIACAGLLVVDGWC